MVELVPQLVLQLLPPVLFPKGRIRLAGRQRPLPLPLALRDLGERAEEEAEGRGERGQQREQGLQRMREFERSMAGKKQTHSTFSTLPEL